MHCDRCRWTQRGAGIRVRSGRISSGRLASAVRVEGHAGVVGDGSSSDRARASCRTTRESATATPSGIGAVEHIKIAPPTGKNVAPLSKSAYCSILASWGGRGCGVCATFVDDAISVGVQWEKGGERCVTLFKALASTYHMLLGEREVGGEQVLSHKMITGRAPRQEIVGCMVEAKESHRCRRGMCRNRETC